MVQIYHYYCLGILIFLISNIPWGEVPKCHDALSAVFFDVVDDYFLQQMVSEPTRRGNILDLIFTNTPEFLMNFNVCEGLGNSDHFSIEFDWKIKLGSLKDSKSRLGWSQGGSR